jgi:hypothetical protein
MTWRSDALVAIAKLRAIADQSDGHLRQLEQAASSSPDAWLLLAVTRVDLQQMAQLTDVLEEALRRDRSDAFKRVGKKVGVLAMPLAAVFLDHGLDAIGTDLKAVHQQVTVTIGCIDETKTTSNPLSDQISAGAQASEANSAKPGIARAEFGGTFGARSTERSSPNDPAEGRSPDVRSLDDNVHELDGVRYRYVTIDGSPGFEVVSNVSDDPVFLPWVDDLGVEQGISIPGLTTGLVQRGEEQGG